MSTGAVRGAAEREMGYNFPTIMSDAALLRMAVQQVLAQVLESDAAYAKPSTM